MIREAMRTQVSSRSWHTKNDSDENHATVCASQREEEGK